MVVCAGIYAYTVFFENKIHTPHGVCEYFCRCAVIKKPHFAQGFVWKSLPCGGNKKATLRTRLRVALKFLKLTTFANEILWWAHRDSNPGPTD